MDLSLSMVVFYLVLANILPLEVIFQIQSIFKRAKKRTALDSHISSNRPSERENSEVGGFVVYKSTLKVKPSASEQENKNNDTKITIIWKKSETERNELTDETKNQFKQIQLIFCFLVCIIIFNHLPFVFKKAKNLEVMFWKLLLKINAKYLETREIIFLFSLVDIYEKITT
ncbi:hypothetical protein RFI_16455 [Reticulomyxa filosa]|uniref:Uncharacterized protein n=1 Tax=Reticulomyxa filosa TaxID=46433 RepID=X6N4R8_RETFI|nr:hypothetical protein RFI_16455 [Reticulomyxa filosa]|eukprot:ETO20759.1 hypothetical protein RFI_16455 [Reticulomyxa filosa]